MKKIVSLCTAWFIILNSFCVISYAVDEVVLTEENVPVMNTYYIATDGDDENPGTIDAPFATLEAAREAIRKQKAVYGLPKGGICVYVREGTYTRLSSFELTDEDAGTKESPITYRPYKNESVKLVGGYQLDVKDFKRVDNTGILNRLYNADAREFIYQYDLSTLPDFEVAPVKYPGSFTTNDLKNAVTLHGNELVCDDQIMNIARWPNVTAEDGGYSGISDVLFTSAEEKVGFKFMIADTARAEAWANSKDAILYGLWSNGWWDSSMNIADVTDGVITTTHRADRFAGPVKDFAMFYIFNLIEELDEPGEFYIDKNTEILYFYPPEDSTRNSEIYISVLDEPMFALKGTSYTTIRGFEIQAIRHQAFSISAGEENLIAYNDIKNIAGYGAAITGGYHNGAVGNHVQRADGGFTLSGGDTKTLTRAENYLENNHVEEFTRLTKTYRGAMNVTGVGNRLSHNEMHNGQHLAMQWANNYNVIEFNEIYDVLQDVDDSGSIYAGATWVWRGSEIRNNYFHDFIGGDMTHGNAAIYFDDNLAGGTVKNNLFVNINGRGIQSTGWDQTWTNNIFMDVNEPMELKNYNSWIDHPLHYDDPYYTEDNVKHYNTFMETPWNSELWLSHFPELEGWDKKDMRFPQRTFVKNNVMINCGEAEFYPEVIENATAIENNIKMEDPGFVDIKNRDFRLKEDAAVYKQLPEFEDIQFEKMGRYDDYIKNAIKDTVVLAVDKAGAYVKGEKTQVDTENDMVFPVVENDRTLVPVRFISEAFDADVSWNEQTQEVTVVLDGKTVKMSMGSNILNIDGEKKEMDVTPVMREDRVHIPLRALVEALGKQVFWDDKGLIIIGDNPYVLDSTEDKYCIDELIRQCNLR